VFRSLPVGSRVVYIYTCRAYIGFVFPPNSLRRPLLFWIFWALFLIPDASRPSENKRERARGSSSVALWKTRERKDSRRPRAGVSLPSKKKFLCCKCRALSVFPTPKPHNFYLSLSSPARTHTQYTSTKNRARTKTRSNGFYLIIYTHTDTHKARIKSFYARERERERQRD
jgi:hypothetical protein